MTDTDTSATTLTTSFAVDRPINLAVRMGRGSLTVRSLESLTTATVELVPNPGAEELVQQFRVAMDGPTLTVTAPREGGLADLMSAWRSRSRDGVAVTVTVPTGTALSLASSSAPITVTGRCGAADIVTASGAITLQHVDGDLLLRYGSGGSHTDRVSGSVTVRSGTGDAHFGVISGALHHGCGSGRLEVGEVHGSVRARSGSGSARLAAVYGDVDLASGSGAMSIGLPPGVAARVNVTTGSGRVLTELPIDDAPARSVETIAVRARTGSGDVELFRAA